MIQDTLYKECPLCLQAPVVRQAVGVFKCGHCGLTLKDKSVLGVLKKGQLGVESLGRGDYSLATEALKNVTLLPDPLKITIGNVYSNSQLAQIAAGQVEVIRPVRTVLAQIILEQLREECFVNVVGIRRGFGPPLTAASWYLPAPNAALPNLKWQDEGNLFCTTQRLVLPSNQFTFIRLGRKVAAVQAYSNAVALQIAGEDYATYFVGCYPHEAALVAAYVMARVPLLRPAPPEDSPQN